MSGQIGIEPFTYRDARAAAEAGVLVVFVACRRDGQPVTPWAQLVPDRKAAELTYGDDDRMRAAQIASAMMELRSYAAASWGVEP